MANFRQHRRAFPLVPLLLCLLAATAYGGCLISDVSLSAPAPLVSEEKCEQSYGFLPCTTTVLGNLFLVLVYGFYMYKAATLLSLGSDLLLEIIGPGLVGGLLLPILSAFPNALLVLVSGLSESKETAQKQVFIGMGLLAGNTIFFLTLLWGTCVVVGKCDLGPNHEAIDVTNTKGFSLTGTGITTDVQTSYVARIMGLSVIPLIIAQFPRKLKTPHRQRVAILLALILSFLFVLSYCLYQVFQPWIQRRKLAYCNTPGVTLT